jgi:pimeloyl-ACP methyl ester carboxylesterase
MSTFNYNNGKIEYEVHGEGSSKTPVVLIHGFALDRRQWGPQIKELEDNGHKVITYDMRGFGNSDDPSGEYSHAEDLKALLDNLEIEKAEICGHSFGCNVGVDFSIRNPAMVEGLTLLAPGLDLYAPSPIPGWKDLIKEKKMDIVSLREEIRSHESLNPLREHTKEFGLVEEMIQDYKGWYFFNKDLEKGAGPITADRLSEVKCPTKIIFGEKDSESNREIAKKLAEELKLEFEVIKDAGHFLNLEVPDIVNESINKFIEGNEELAEQDGELRLVK